MREMISQYYIELVMHHPFLELAAIMMIAIMVTLIMKALRQPVIIGYILTGILVSPSLLNLIQHQESIEMFAHIWVVILLFMVWLGLNPKTIRELGKTALILGIGQVVFTVLVWVGISMALGFDLVTSIIIGICLAFSSTIIIVKLLTDNKSSEEVYGKISIGMLIVQDLIAMLVLMVLAGIPGGGEAINWSEFLIPLMIKWVWLAAVVYVLGRWVVPRVFAWVADSQELLVLFSVTLCFVMAGATQALEFSMEIGALLAGVILASGSYRFEIMTKMKPIRDFFLVMFFVYLGSGLSLDSIGDQIGSIVLLSLFVLIGNPLIVMIIMGMMWYKKKVGMMTGFTVAQISEFSFIVLGIAYGSGLITDERVGGIITMVWLVTIAGSSYYFTYAEQIYHKIGAWLWIFERTHINEAKSTASQTTHYDTLVFGNHRTGASIIAKLAQQSKSYLIIDYDPIVIKQLEADWQPCMYGDASDIMTYDELDLSHVQMVVSTIHSYDTSMTLLREIKSQSPNAVTIMSAHYTSEAESLYETWADYVVIPHIIGGEHTAMLIEECELDIDKYIAHKQQHLALIQGRK